MVFRMRVKRGWDQACDKAEIAFGAVGMLGGRPHRLAQVTMSLSHDLTLVFVPCREDAEANGYFRYWLRSLIRSHR